MPNLFIPAAGLGTRLRPLTNHFPKPLIPLLGVPLIQRIIEKITDQIHVDNIGINTHHLPAVVHQWVKESPFKKQISLFHEEEILGTGGALKNAAPLLQKDTFILANGDVVSDINWQQLYKHHKENGHLITLAVQDREHERRVGVNASLKLQCIDKECKTPGIDHWFGYACAAVYEPEFLDYLPEGESHVVPFWVSAALETGRVGVFDIGKETYWLDIGNPQSYVQAVVDLLGGEKRFLREPLKTPWDCQLVNQVVIESDVQIGTEVSLKNTILLPGAQLDRTSVDGAVIGPDFDFSVDWPDISPKQPLKLQKIGNGGSDRVYCREDKGVVLHYSAFEENIDRQMELTLAFQAKGINVPDVIAHNPRRRQLTLQDLGDLTFKAWIQRASEKETLAMFEKILEMLWIMQGVEDQTCPSIHDKPFNYQVLRWESSYFIERFVQRVAGIVEKNDGLQEEFHRLAAEVDSLPKRVMHRDFQSENIMVHQDAPWFIDFQGAHWGPSYFDLVSLLRDPYLNLTEDFTKDLRNHFLCNLGILHGLTGEECQRAYDFCGLQRHMQALGAYGFITHIRSKEFLDSVPAALKFLSLEIKDYADEFPNLFMLIGRLREKMNV